MIIQVKRGTTAEAAARVGLEGTFFIDLDTKLVYVHDGVTVGGTLVSGLGEAAVNQLIDTKLEALVIADIEGLETALAAIPVKATGAELIAGTDNAKFATAASLLALLNDIGFTKDGNGDWHLAAGVVTP